MCEQTITKTLFVKMLYRVHASRAHVVTLLRSIYFFMHPYSDETFLEFVVFCVLVAAGAFGSSSLTKILFP